MKIKNLVIVFGLCVLGFISCTKDEVLPSDSVEQEIEFRNDDDDGPEECCDFDWVIQSKETNEGCCTYEILVINNGNCQIQIVGLPNGILDPQTSRIYEITVCGKGVTTFNVYASVNQTSTPCGAISLTADCSKTCSCNVSIERNECILIANIGDDCQGPLTYLWTYPNGATSTYVGDITAFYSGVYSLLVTDANGCTSEDFITIDDCEDVISDCDEDCVFILQTTDQGKDVQFTHFLRVDDDCTDENSEEFCGDNGEGNVILKNESGCSNEEVRDIWNAYGLFPVLDLIDFSDYQSCVESEITSRKGCENAQVSVELNSLGGIDYEITYDCASCELIFIEAQEKSFNVTEDCVGIVFPTGSEIIGGPMNCGPCY